MSSPRSHPLKYLAEALVQIAATLRDFEMGESADLIDRAKSDIDEKLAEKPKTENDRR